MAKVQQLTAAQKRMLRMIRDGRLLYYITGEDRFVLTAVSSARLVDCQHAGTQIHFQTYTVNRNTVKILRRNGLLRPAKKQSHRGLVLWRESKMGELL